MTTSAVPFCIGHSHVACVEDAARELGAPLTAINFWQSPTSQIQATNGSWQLSETTAEKIARHDGPIFSLVGGASYGVLGMLVHPRPWDFVSPGSIDPEEPVGYELIPFGAVKATLTALMQEYLTMIGQIAQCARRGVFQIEPPPPYADAARIAPHIYWSLYPGMRQEISPAAFRLRLWSLQSQILRDYCRDSGVGFVSHPASTATRDGFMADDYFFDGAHANRAYGTLVLRQMQGIHEASV